MTGETIVRLRAPLLEERDRYGGAVRDWDNAVSVEIDGCAVSPRFEAERTDQGRQGVIIGLTVYAPAGTDVLPTDRVIVRGDWANPYEIDGQPGDWTNPYDGRSRGVEFALKRVDG